MKKTLIALICIAVVFSFTACEKSTKTKLIGTWEGEDITLALNKDKTYTALGFHKYYDSMYLDEEEYGTFSFNDSKIVFVDVDWDSNVFEYEMFDDGILIDGNFYKKADKSLDLHKTYGGSLSGVYRTEGYRVFYEYYFDGTNVYEVSGFLYDSESEYGNYGELYEEAWDKKEGTLFGDEYYFLGDYLVIDDYLYSKVDRKKTNGSITGIWENTETTIEFKNGGVAVVDGDSANYSYKNGTLVFTYEGRSISMPCTVYDNNLMFLESPYDDDEFMVLTRKE